MMEQINFRLLKDEKEILATISRSQGISMAEFAKKAVLKEISALRVDLGFNLLEEGKIGFKRAWKISGLTYHEFLIEWNNRGAEEKISQIAEEKGLKEALSFDLIPYFKENKRS
jgi:predicted HTH domain antitoxin